MFSSTENYWIGTYDVKVPNHIKEIYAEDGGNLYSKDGGMTAMDVPYGISKKEWFERHAECINGQWWYVKNKPPEEPKKCIKCEKRNDQMIEKCASCKKGPVCFECCDLLEYHPHKVCTLCAKYSLSNPCQLEISKCAWKRDGLSCVCMKHKTYYLNSIKNKSRKIEQSNKSDIKEVISIKKKKNVEESK